MNKKLNMEAKVNKIERIEGIENIKLLGNRIYFNIINTEDFCFELFYDEYEVIIKFYFFKKTKETNYNLLEESFETTADFVSYFNKNINNFRHYINLHKEAEKFLKNIDK